MEDGVPIEGGRLPSGEAQPRNVADVAEGLRSSQMIRQLAEADGPHNYTRARARLNFNPSGLATVSNSADVFDLNED